ncbi:hypothetical protein GXB81_21980 [Paraburkholderia sp. Ac-20336]|uniref:hypothetical protein n=1 Tax=Paraburkholderia sp. Ac-20336 TaxID=2703886 RepID=UPI0019810EBA|nr:hypothetical protein [Paraburkholderia sp. Ac-20336]MBN3805701.1 hypothetical protein [Paraburkholderia sp. Ac-20336]
MPGLYVEPENPPRTGPARLPARSIWHRSPDTLVYPYDSIDEAELAAQAGRRTRNRIVLAASVLAVSSAVYLICIHDGDLRVAPPVVASGNVSTVSAQNGKASVAVDGAGKAKANAGSLQPGSDAQRVAAARPSAVTPAAASLPEPRRVAPAAPDAARVAAAQPIASTPEQHQVVSATSDATHVTAAQPIAAKDKPHADASPSVIALQQQQRPQPAIAAQHLASAQPAALTPQVAAIPEQRRVVSATPDATRVAAAQPIAAKDKPHADAAPSRVTAQQQQQPQPAVAAQHLASVHPSTATPPTAAQPQQHRVSLTTAEPTHLAANPPISAEEKRRAEAARYLRAARINLKANNLSATKSRIAAALAAQPDNREAQRLRATVHTLEQQRDALLSLARGCGSIGHLACVSRDAGIALQIDSSSKTARRLSTQATRESELQIAPSADTATEPLPDVRYVSTHH